MALLSYEDSLCPGCGQRKDVAFNPDSDGWFEAREVVCAGCAAKQNHEHGDQNRKPTPGAKVYVVDGRPADLELRPWRLGAEPDDDSDDDRDDAR